MAIEYEPYSPQVRADPYPHYAALRREAPVYRAPSGQWVLSRHEDVLFALRRPDLFSSDAVGAMLAAGGAGAAPGSGAEAARRAAAVFSKLPFEPADLVRSRGLINADPPAHGPLRDIVNRGFTPRRIAAWEPRAREIVRSCTAGLRRGEAFDAIADLAIPLPVTIIAEMLGVEPERREDFKRWSDTMIASTSGSRRERDPGESGMAETIGEFARYLTEVVERRRREPREDLISVLTRAQDGELALAPLEVVMFSLLLLVAGNETTTNLIGNAVNTLLDHPEQLERVRADPARMPALVEETLRFESPVQFVQRRARKELEIAGTRLPANATVLLLLGSANRDERRFERADLFDVGRDASGHLAFGFGVHFCLGASLARLEARVALEALVPELPRLARGSPSAELVDSFLVRGPRRLDLVAAPPA